MKSQVQNIIQSNRLFSILHEQLISDEDSYDEKLYLFIEDFINSYIAFHRLTNSEVEKIYFDYIKTYNKDLRKFKKTGLYPLEYDKERAAPDRVSYNIILLLSVLLNKHRFKIMKSIREMSSSVTSGLFIGIGPGLEIKLIEDLIEHVVAYDLTLDTFLENSFDSIDFRNEYFDGTGNDRYDVIYLIEILEHLEDPFELLKNCLKVLNPNGKIYLTTATDIPQFDHLYNFAGDHIDFDNRVKELGTQIKYSEDILHAGLTHKIASKNKIYILQPQ